MLVAQASEPLTSVLRSDAAEPVCRRGGGEGRWDQTSSIRYDCLGRKTGMSDAELGGWRYACNALGQLTRQTDARGKTSCLYYSGLGRMRGRLSLGSGQACGDSVADSDLGSIYVYDAKGRVQRVSNDNVSRSFAYDDHHRHTAVTYPGGEVITTTYGSPGVAVGLSSSVSGALVD